MRDDKYSANRFRIFLSLWVNFAFAHFNGELHSTESLSETHLSIPEESLIVSRLLKIILSRFYSSFLFVTQFYELRLFALFIGDIGLVNSFCICHNILFVYLLSLFLLTISIKRMSQRSLPVFPFLSLWSLSKMPQSRIFA